MRIKRDILATLTYFNMFDHPLRRREIYIFLGHLDVRHEFDEALNILVNEAAIFKIGEFYSIQNNYALADRRYKGNERAAVMLKQAERSASVVSSFPFVKGVAVSGSLSKNVAAEDADIDLFIITSAGRLWLARTFLHAFKKFTFLFNRQHFFCMNYFVDEAAMVILEKNIYTATEISTIMPLRGNAVFDRFYAVNKWTKIFLPNNYMRVSSAKDVRLSWLRKMTEWLLNNRAGSMLDDILMNLTTKSWNAKKRKSKKNIKGELMALHAGKHFSKPDPINFQRKILSRYENDLATVTGHYELTGRLKKEFL